MRIAIFVCLVFLVNARPAWADVPHYTVRAQPANTLLNNNGLVAIPAELVTRANSFVSGVNDAGEFCGGDTFLFGGVERFTSNTWVYLPVPTHGLPAGITNSLFVGSDGGHVAINSAGQTAGNVSEQPYVWSPQSSPGFSAGITSVPTTVLQPETARWASANALNNVGQVVGTDVLYPNKGSADYVPYVWSPIAANGLPAGITYLTTLPNGWPTAINIRGDVVGNFFLFLSKPGFGLAGGVHPLSLPAADVNDNMEVVGGSKYWSPTTGLLDLNSLIPSGSGWVLSNATQINNRGDIIGTGTFNGQPASFFLTTPEPAVMVGIPLLLCVGRRRRDC